MKIYKTLLVLSVLILMSCATMMAPPIRDFDSSNMYFTSEDPHLKIKIVDKYTTYRGKEENRLSNGLKETHTFKTIMGDIFGIEIWTDWEHREYYSDEHYANETWNGIILGKEIINGNSWLQVAFAVDKGQFVGYFRRQDNHLIFVSQKSNSLEYKNEIENYRNTHNLSTELKAYLEKRFETTKEMFIIEE